MQRHTFTALNSTFVVDAEYQFVKELGQGAYGCVVAAKHRRTGDGCAIKKITNINTKVSLSSTRACTKNTERHTRQRILTKRCLREIRCVGTINFLPSLPNATFHPKAAASFPRTQERSSSKPEFYSGILTLNAIRLRAYTTWISFFNRMGISMKSTYMYVLKAVSLLA
jgi:serine/threonine protein kinase